MKSSLTRYLRKIANSLLGDKGAPHHYKWIPKQIESLLEKGEDGDHLHLLNNEMALIHAYSTLGSREEKEKYLKNLGKLFGIAKSEKIDKIRKQLKKKLQNEFDMQDGEESLSTLD